MSSNLTISLEVLGAFASLVVILEYFGVKPKGLSWGVIMPLSRNWKLVIMLGLVAISLGFSGYGFYRSLHPKIVEKIVEKPVDRIVEKIVPQECPQPNLTGASKRTPGIVIPPSTTINATTNAPNSMAAGINTGTMIQGDASPQFILTALGENMPTANGFYETRFRLQIATKHTIVLQLKATGTSLASRIGFIPEVPAGAGGSSVVQYNVQWGPTFARTSVQNIDSGNYLINIQSTQPDKVHLEYTP